MNAYLSIDEQTLRGIDFTGARVIRAVISSDLELVSPSLQQLRKLIFTGIGTPELLSTFSCVTDDPTKGSSFKKQDGFCGFMCPSDYKYSDGQRLSLFIRNSNANEIMRDVLKALSGNAWVERLFKLSCKIDLVLHSGAPVTIQVRLP